MKPLPSEPLSGPAKGKPEAEKILLSYPIKKGLPKSPKIPLENQHFTNSKSLIKNEYLYDMEKRVAI